MQYETGSEYSQSRGEGVEAFIDHMTANVSRAVRNSVSWSHFVNEIADQYAYIRLRDIKNPVRFLSQMAGVPPVQFGDLGFREELLDDRNPARHYVALLYVGFYLPTWLAIITLYVWELAGCVRYGVHWSQADIRSGMVGVRHGALVRKYGPTILPSLIAAHLVEPDDGAKI